MISIEGRRVRLLSDFMSLRSGRDRLVRARIVSPQVSGVSDEILTDSPFRHATRELADEAAQRSFVVVKACTGILSRNHDQIQP